MNHAALNDPLLEIEVGIAGDMAASLGHAARKLKAAIAELAAAREAECRPLRYKAASALWAYVVQRELIGLHDTATIGETYSVPPELWRLLGAAP